MSKIDDKMYEIEGINLMINLWAGRHTRGTYQKNGNISIFFRLYILIQIYKESGLCRHKMLSRNNEWTKCSPTFV